jgi:hypothetical protein
MHVTVSVPLAELPDDAIIGAGAAFFRWPKAKVLPASSRKMRTGLMICFLPLMISSIHARRHLFSGMMFIGNHFRGLTCKQSFDVGLLQGGCPLGISGLKKFQGNQELSPDFRTQIPG